MAVELAVVGLACVRGGRTLYRDLNVMLASGGLLAVSGPNGAGKTSLLRQLAGLLPAAGGTIRIRTDETEASEPEERGRFVGWLGHADAVKPQMTVREQLRFHARLYRHTDGIEIALMQCGLAALAEYPGARLSAGQTRRLALARLIVGARPLWLLDEPVSALDEAGRAMLCEIVSAHCAKGGIAVAAGHEALGLPCETLKLGGEA
jgi:heme exporter protein A